MSVFLNKDCVKSYLEQNTEVEEQVYKIQGKINKLILYKDKTEGFLVGFNYNNNDLKTLYNICDLKLFKELQKISEDMKTIKNINEYDKESCILASQIDDKNIISDLLLIKNKGYFNDTQVNLCKCVLKDLTEYIKRNDDNIKQNNFSDIAEKMIDKGFEYANENYLNDLPKITLEELKDIDFEYENSIAGTNLEEIYYCKELNSYGSVLQLFNKKEELEKIKVENNEQQNISFYQNGSLKLK